MGKLGFNSLRHREKLSEVSHILGVCPTPLSYWTKEAEVTLHMAYCHGCAHIPRNTSKLLIQLLILVKGGNALQSKT